MENVDFLKFDEIFLEKSWQWITSEPVKTLIDAEETTKEQQLEWYKKLETRTDYLIEGINYKSRPIGAWGLKKITVDKAEYFGYIGEPEFWGLGIGKLIMAQAINEAKRRNLKLLYLHVLNFNERALRLYRRFGFIENPEKSEGMLLYMETNI